MVLLVTGGHLAASSATTPDVRLFLYLQDVCWRPPPPQAPVIQGSPQPGYGL
jgi:hypothetical protein